MSLITEALRKARQEAADREGRLRGIPRGLAVPPTRWRAWRPLALVILIAAGALGGAVVTWWLVGRHVPSISAAGTSLAPVATSPAPTAPPSPQPSASERALGPPAAVAGRPEAAPRQPVEPPAPASEARAASPGGQNAPEEAEAARARRAESADTTSRERSFVVDADLGYAKLHLDYIVYRPGSPFAGINGEQVVIGTKIDGFQVEEIGADSVRLQGSRGTVILRTH
jgi:hypothetical protein